MKMKPEEIKSKKVKLQAELNKCLEELENLKSICKHEKTEKQLYSYRIGCVDEVYMCDYCDEIINNHSS